MDFEEKEIEQAEWKGNKDYFQTGKKKGTLKPKAKAPEYVEVKPPKIEATQPEKVFSIEDELNRLNDVAVKEETSETSEEITPVENQLITGYILLLVCDGFFPNIFNVISKKFFGYEVNKSDLRLTTEERKDLEPLADECARMITQNGNPFLMFGLVYGIITYGKLMDAKKTIVEKPTKKKKDESNSNNRNDGNGQNNGNKKANSKPKK